MQNKFYFIVLFFVFSLAFGQNKEVLKMQMFYDELEFEKCIDQGTLALQNSKQMKLKDIALVHQYLALAYFELGKTDSSRFHFESLLNIVPDFKPDPVKYSPKLIRFFNQIKKEYLNKEGEKNSVKVEKQYYIALDPRPGATWRSAILPGWGQLYKKHTTRGYVFFSTFTFSVSGLILAKMNENKARSSYLAASSAAQAKDRYKTFDRWFQTRRAFSYLTLGIWATSILDALISQPGHLEFVPASTSGIQINIKF